MGRGHPSPFDKLRQALWDCAQDDVFVVSWRCKKQRKHVSNSAAKAGFGLRPYRSGQKFSISQSPAVLVTFFVLFQSFFYAADHGLGIEFGPDNLVGAVTFDGDTVIAHKGNVLIRIAPS